jgi:hypothetical protein
MNCHQARKILDLVREGRDYPVFIINQALYIVSEITEEQYEKTNQIQTQARLNQSTGFCD